MTLQARGPGLAPINTDAESESLIAWLRREGYTDIQVVSNEKVKRNGKEQPKARRVVRRPSERQQADHQDPARNTGTRRVVRTPRAKSG